MKTIKVSAWLLTVMLFVFSHAYSATADIRWVTMSPSTVAPGGQITVNFGISNDQNYPHCFAVGIAQFSDPVNSRCGIDWVAGGNGIYARSTASQTYYYDGTSATHTGLTRTISEITDGNGICLPANGINTVRSVTIVANVPPEKAGTFYAVVTARGNNNNDIRWECNDGLVVNETMVSSSFTVAGTTTPYKLDLEWCLQANNTSNFEFYYRIVNYSESGVGINDVRLRYYIYDTDTNWTQAHGAIQKVYNAGGGTSYGPDMTSSYTFSTMADTDCPDTGSRTRRANLYYERYFNITSGVPAYLYIPNNGGYVTNFGSQETRLRQNDSGTLTNSDDYSDITELSTCGGSRPSQDNKYTTLFHSGNHVCEYDNESTIDDETGEIPCGISACTRIYMEKSASPMDAYVGDTITYCITYTNNTGASQAFNVWDTVPAVMTYVGCNGCSVNYYGSTTVVYWPITAADGTYGTLCFWARITSYPMKDKNSEFASYMETRKLVSSKYF